jgi:hypothetical protein
LLAALHTRKLSGVAVPAIITISTAATRRLTTMRSPTLRRAPVEQNPAPLDVGQLIVLTSGGEFKVTGDSNGNLTGTGGFAMSGQSFNGSSDLAPINVGSVALYVQQKGSIIRDLFYSFDQDSYQSSDLTLLASHLFNGYSIRDWALSVQPFSVAWCARSDGMLLGLTYLREQQVYAWHPHPMTNGYVESICSISEGQEDAVYALIRRTVNGSTVRYVERLNTRQFTEQQDAFFVDSGLSYSGENTDYSRTMTIGSAGGWTYQDEFTLTCSSAIFDSSSTDYEIHIPTPRRCQQVDAFEHCWCYLINSGYRISKP